MAVMILLKWRYMNIITCITARAGHGMVNLEDHLYVAGGYNGSVESQLRCLVSVEQYSVETNQWTKLTAMKLGIAFFEMTGIVGSLL